MDNRMTRRRFNELYGKEPLLSFDHGRVRIRGYELAPRDMRGLIAQKIADCTSLVLRVDYAAQPR